MQKVTVQLVDDLDGTTIDDGHGRTILFALDGKSYELDLSTNNIQRLEAALEPFIAVARPSARGRSRSVKFEAPASNPAELQAMRDWANSNGFQVSNRGRVSAVVREAYAAAH
ncbi:MAG: lysylphosphatidylglycerol synthetase [Rhodoglobus sp.]|nr:lysylphosphatidylglycerol synthetase [Rhodoglobus sp.]